MSSHLHLEVPEGLSADTPPRASKGGGFSQIPAIHSPGYLLPTDTAWLPPGPVLIPEGQHQEPEQGPDQSSPGKEG